MSAASQLRLVTVQQYLEMESSSSTRHEYLGEMVHAMSAGRTVHNLVATNISSALWSRLRGQPC